MKKYYVTILTEDDKTMILTTKERDMDRAKDKIMKNYEYIKDIIHISETPSLNEDVPQMSSSIGYKLMLPYRRKSKIYNF